MRISSRFGAVTRRYMCASSGGRGALPQLALADASHGCEFLYEFKAGFAGPAPALRLRRAGAADSRATRTIMAMLFGPSLG
jgi:hypothetical protein